MKSFNACVFAVCAVLLVSLTNAAPVDDSKNAEILKYENDNNGLGSYNFAYETSNGVSRSEQASLNNVGTENEATSVQGSYKWVDPEGHIHTINFVADENGYQPEGEDIPKAQV
ncbi:endocuticle structural glycoprotein SgAbd-5-like [Drosophila innubila]|uniref:endocuticle structural glycoprotein SgAbd-5-like n=1 Tax=Drosophila innubila TaxID=198719 RepID=UPI00148B57D1|nr:endocuticle structural glycoprotein SgAbd-5-like [Drosophila innubila]